VYTDFKVVKGTAGKLGEMTMEFKANNYIMIDGTKHEITGVGIVNIDFQKGKTLMSLTYELGKIAFTVDSPLALPLVYGLCEFNNSFNIEVTTNPDKKLNVKFHFVNKKMENKVMNHIATKYVKLFKQGWNK
jgi:hypothetical protein